MSIPLFFNNMARGARANRFRQWLSAQKGQFDVVEPDSPEDMRRRLKEQAAAGAAVAAVAGGDGTLGIAAEALCGSSTALALFPAGTANVFARETGFRQNFDFALRILRQGKIREVDLFALNGKPFLQMAGVGLDARAIELTSWEMKKKWGALAYVISGLKALTETPPRLTLRTDDGREAEGCAILLGNGARYGGPFTLFAEASNNDGALDAIIFKKSYPSLLRECLLAAVHGGFHSHRDGAFEYIRLSGGEIRSSQADTPFEMDGDRTGTTPIRIERLGSLRVFAP